MSALCSPSCHTRSHSIMSTPLHEALTDSLNSLTQHSLNSLTHSLTHSLNSFTQLTHSLIQATQITHSLTLPTYSLNKLPHSLTNSLTHHSTKRDAALRFSELLQLKTWGAVECSQSRPFGDITVSLVEAKTVSA